MCLMVVFLVVVLALFIFFVLSDSWIASYYECKRVEQQIYLEWLREQEKRG